MNCSNEQFAFLFRIFKSDNIFQIEIIPSFIFMIDNIHSFFNELNVYSQSE